MDPELIQEMESLIYYFIWKSKMGLVLHALSKLSSVEDFTEMTGATMSRTEESGLKNT